MTVAQYEERFNTLSRFCPRVVPDDAARAEQFKMGLWIEIRKQVNMARNLTYAELVENAGIAKRDLLEDSSAAPSRSGSQSSGGPSKASPSVSTGRPAAVSASNSSGGSTRRPTLEERTCYTCGQKGHLSRDCPGTREVSCHHCGQTRHIRPRCPLLAGGSVTTTTPAISGALGASTAANRGRGGARSRTSNKGRGGRTRRVFAMTEQDAEASNDVAIGTMTVFSHTAKIVFNPGATHSFISTSFLRYADMTPEPLDEPLFIATLMGDSLEIRQIYSPCILTFGEWEFRADLLPFEMHDFDLILGMDWLAAYHASINCYSKEVIL
ncbi:uncharacterized protein [Typha angustifolia]|uniref:uncharacterized protein n=1 Tax=Typha angustifolia TaxID=59011 RepID=UPI003C30BCB5